MTILKNTDNEKNDDLVGHHLHHRQQAHLRHQMTQRYPVRLLVTIRKITKLLKYQQTCNYWSHQIIPLVALMLDKCPLWIRWLNDECKKMGNFYTS